MSRDVRQKEMLEENVKMKMMKSMQKKNKQYSVLPVWITDADFTNNR